MTTTGSASVDSARANIPATEQATPDVGSDTNNESFTVEFVAHNETGNSEKPLEKAIRLVRLELDALIEQEKLKHYLDTLFVSINKQQQ